MMGRVSIVELQNYWKNEIMPHYHVEKEVQLIFALYLKHLAMLQLGRELRVLQEIGEDNLLWPSKPLLATFEDLDIEISLEGSDVQALPSPGCPKELRSFEKTWTRLSPRRVTGLSRPDNADPA